MKPFQAGDSLAQCQRSSALDAMELRMLLGHALGLTRVQLITRSETSIDESQAQRLNDLVQQRLDGAPIAYLLGEREFYGLNFKVSPAVLIPRPETELLVDLALQFTPKNGELLDLGTGSGAIAVAAAAQEHSLKVSAADISPDALAIAQKNAQRLLSTRAPLDFFLSDWYNGIPQKQFHTIVSNPPYIVQGDAHLSQGDLRFEPIDALTDHGDGLSAYRHIIGGAAARLHDQGWLLMEHGYDQADAVQALLREHGFQAVQSWPDLAGILRVTGGQR